MKSHTVEYLRFGDATGILRLSDKYIRNVGVSGLGAEVSFELAQAQLEHAMKALDYAAFARKGAGAREAAEDVLLRLAPFVERFLLHEDVEAAGGEYVQVDVVTRALELAQLPFEVVEESRPALVVTRRIRRPWPPPPVVGGDQVRILFAWAEPGRMTVPHERHLALLRTLLRNLGSREAIVEVPHATRPMLEDHLNSATPPTHVHLLAHGVPPEAAVDFLGPQAPSPSALLALERENGAPDPCAPDELAGLLRGPTPQAVTLATCSSAEVDPIQGGASIAHALHAAGVPVVVASQFALTQDGSDLLVSVFLARLLEGLDPRVALRRCRDALRAQTATTYYDRVALVGYVHVDPDIDARLKARQFKVALARLKANSLSAKAQVDRLLESASAARELTPDEAAAAASIGTVFREVREGLARLAQGAALSAEEREELYGLQASALKRDAEAAWALAQCLGPAGAEWATRSRDVLRGATEAYGRAARISRDHHWTWVQWLALLAIQAPQACGAHADDWTAAKAAAGDAAHLHPPPEGAEDRDRVLDRSVWGWGSLAELYLLAPLFGRPEAMDEARRCLDALVAAARSLGRQDPIDATRAQLSRYDTWWGADGALALPPSIVAAAVALRDYLVQAAASPPEGA
ncbi:MAG: CHAT domain-containing protein [Vicinamibacterales bacterium]